MRRMPCPSNSSSIPLRRLFVDHCRNPSLFPSRISNSSDDNDDSEDYAFRVAVAFLFHHCRKGIIITITTNWRKKTTKAIGTKKKKNEMQQARPSIMQLDSHHQQRIPNRQQLSTPPLKKKKKKKIRFRMLVQYHSSSYNNDEDSTDHEAMWCYVTIGMNNEKKNGRPAININRTWRE